MKKLVNILLIFFQISVYSQTKLDSMIVDEINKERAKYNICPVEYDFNPAIYKMVKHHSDYIAAFDIYGHDELKGDTIVNGDTLISDKYFNRYQNYIKTNNYFSGGENVSVDSFPKYNRSIESLYDTISKNVVYGFINELPCPDGIRGHRESLLNVNSIKACVSVKITETTKLYEMKYGSNPDDSKRTKMITKYHIYVTIFMLDNYYPEFVIKNISKYSSIPYKR